MDEATPVSSGCLQAEQIGTLSQLQPTPALFPLKLGKLTLNAPSKQVFSSMIWPVEDRDAVYASAKMQFVYSSLSLCKAD